MFTFLSVSHWKCGTLCLEKKTSIARKMKTVIRCNQKCDSRDFVFLEGRESMDTESEGRDLYYQSQINWKYTSYVL